MGWVIAIGTAIILLGLVCGLIVWLNGDVFDDGLGYLFGEEETDEETEAIEDEG
jgi:hypothetical protein